MSTTIRGQGLTAYKTPDSALSNTSKNSVQNKVVNENITDLDSRIGNISALKTEDKTSLVKAINEVAENAGSVTMDEYCPAIEITRSQDSEIGMRGSAADRPISLIEVDLVPFQNGTGTPSSENVRTIEGLTELQMVICNNQLDEFFTTPPLPRSGTGTPSPENPMPILPNLSFEKDDGSVINIYYGDIYYGTMGSSSRINFQLPNYTGAAQIKNLEWTMPSESIFCCVPSDVVNTYSAGQLSSEGCRIYESVASYASESALISGIENYKMASYKSSAKRYIKDTRYTTIEDFIAGVGDEIIYYNRSWSDADKYTINLNESTRLMDQLNDQIGRDYSYYTREIDWEQTAGTIYGGTVTIDKEGNVTVTKEWDIIQSYNNEMLPGEWLSSIDEYAEGTIPSVGAQVVYKLAEPSVTYHFTIEPLRTYSGNTDIVFNILEANTTFYYTYQQDVKGYTEYKNYVTRSDYPSPGVAGVVMVQGSYYGLEMKPTYVGGPNNRIQIAKATDAQVKAGTDQYMPIVPANQKNSVFYGLAAAAGDTTQKSSNNAVGTYTDTAKTKIKTMLGVDGGRVEVLTPTETTLTLKPVPTTYKWGEVASLTLTVTADSEYHFMFTCPSGAATVLNTPGITGTMGDDLVAGSTYEVDIWAGIRSIREIEVTAV